MFTTPITVRFSDLDPYGHVNHSVFLTYFEVARSAILQEKDMGLDAVLASGFQFVVSEITVKYLRPAVLSDALHIESAVIKKRRASMVWRQSLCSASETLATGLVTLVVTNRDGAVVRPPKELLDFVDIEE